MATLDNLFLQSELSLAAYANLTVGEPNKQLVKDAGMADIEAARFASRWRVVDQLSDPANGLSATVFKQVSTGKSYLAIRGTDDLLDAVTDLITVSLMGTTTWQRQYVALRAKVQAWLANGTLPRSFTVTGHSLGGFLATGIAAEFSANVEHAYLYNAPGLNGLLGIVTAPILRALGVPFPVAAAKVSNIKADAGISPIAGLGAQMAPPVRVVIENQLSSDVPSPPAARNHSQETLTDALALYALFGAIDPAISTDRIADLLKAASAQNNRTLESSLDALRNIFGFNEATPTEDRESFYNNLYSLRTNTLFERIANSDAGSNATEGRIVSLLSMDTNQLVANAKRDFGYFFALNTLNPFAAIDAGSTFSATHGELYQLWQADQSLTAADRSAVQGNFSDAYLRDRAQFLTWKNRKNLDDIADGVSIPRKDNGVESFLYTDKTLKNAQGQDYSIWVMGNQVDPIRVSFAGDGGDALQGGNYADHLYGGRGRDTLAGRDGDDYLEGGAGDDALAGDAGADTLIGGNGADTLAGGAGNDTLRGGKGDDILQGGAGDDVYFINTDDGRDTIVDHEGRNTIIYVDANGKSSVLGIPAFSIEAQSNTWTGYLAGGGSITFTRNSPLTATLPGGSQIVIDDYQDGEFGIQLKNVAHSEPTGITVLGDFEPVHFSQRFDQGVEVFWQSDEDEFDNTITDPSKPAPGMKDWLFGSNGNDFIAGFGGDDQIYGGEGADRLQGGAGMDRIYGEDGDDVIEGQDESTPGDGYNFLDGGAGDDTIFATTESDIETALAQATDAEIEGRGGRLYGGPGDDVIIGSKGPDRIAGGQGGDVLIGGGGPDYILGELELSGGLDPYYGSDPGTAADDGDAIYGGSGGDSIRAGLGDDYVDGGDGDDVIFGEGGSDVLFGGAGRDSIFAIVNDANVVTFDESDDYIDSGDGNDGIVGSAGDNILLGGAGDDVIAGGGGDDFIDGGTGNDRIQGNDAHGGAGDDVVAGTPGADTLYGDDGDDVLAGWNFLWYEPFDVGPSAGVLGDDWLYGGAGDDTYMFALGAGISHIVDDSGVDRIALTSYEINAPDFGVAGLYAPIASGSVGFEFQDGTYKLIYGDAGDSIDLGASLGGTMPAVSLNHIGLGVSFDDNADPEHLDPRQSVETSTEVLSWSDIAVNQNSTPEGGTLVATEGFSNALTGKAGNDVLIGASRDDVLIGGPGDDTLDGGDGGDRYVFNPGDGVDLISDSGTQGTDTLAFGPGISADDLSLGTDSLLIRIDGSGDAVYVDGFDSGDAGTAGEIERFEFADGTVLSHAQLVSRGFDLYGTDGDDTAFGTSLVDRFRESAGDDTLIGGAGDDAYYFGVGSGHDFVVDSDATPNNFDTVVLGSGITAGNLSVVSGAGMLTLAVAGADDRLDIQWQPQVGYAIERVQFADGTIWDQVMLESQAAPASQADAGAGAAGGGAGPAVGGGAPPAGGGTADAGAGMPASGDVVQIGSSQVPPADSAAANPGAGTPVSDGVVHIGGSEGPPADGGPPGVDAGTVPNGSTTSTGSGAEPAREHPQLGDLRPTPAPDGGTMASPNSRTAAQSRQDAIAAAILSSGAVDAAAAIDAAGAPVSPRTSAKPVDLTGAQFASAQTALSANPASFFGAPPPAQPNLQSWLDNWLGPRARASGGARETSSTTPPGEGGRPKSVDDDRSMSVEDSGPPSIEDFAPPNLPDDVPESQPAEPLTPEEIAQHYEDINIWLEANPGIEQGIAGASGSAPERNPFTYIGAGSMADSGFASMPGFGQSPGMAALGGQTLQRLQGLREGYTPFGIV